MQFVAPDVRVTLPLQNVVGPEAFTMLLGAVFIDTIVPLDDLEQPPLCVTVTVYVPAVLTLIDCVVEPFDHRKLVPAFAESITDELEQIFVDPLGVIVAVGDTIETAIVFEIDVHPLLLVTVTR